MLLIVSILSLAEGRREGAEARRLEVAAVDAKKLSHVNSAHSDPRAPAASWASMRFKSCTAATSNRARIAKGHTESVCRSVPRNAQVSPLRLGTGCFFVADAGPSRWSRLRGEHREGGLSDQAF
jgi:hypothetical protein